MAKVNLDNPNTKQYSNGYLFGKYMNVKFIILNSKNKKIIMGLTKVYATLNIMQSADEALGGLGLTGSIKVYANLGAEKSFQGQKSLIEVIKEVVADTNFNNESRAGLVTPLRAEITWGYISQPKRTEITKEVALMYIGSGRDEGYNTPFYEFNFLDQAVFNKNMQGIRSQPDRVINLQNRSYLDILVIMYYNIDVSIFNKTNPDPKLVEIAEKAITDSKARLPFFFVDSLKEKLDIKPLENNPEQKLRYTISGEIATASNPQATMLIAFWKWFFGKEKVGAGLYKNLGMRIATAFDEENYGIKPGEVIYYIKDPSDPKQTFSAYCLLDDSKIMSIDSSEPSFVKVNCVYDPAIVKYGAVAFRSKYTSSTITILAANNITNDSTLQDRYNNLDTSNTRQLPIYYLIAYTLNFSTAEASPATMSLWLSPQPVAINVFRS